MKESLCLKFFQHLIWQALKWSWIHKSMVAIFKIFFLLFFPSWSCCFLPGVVLLKLCWTGIGQIEWPLVVTGSHSGNALPFQRAHACQPPHFLISNNRLPFSTNNRLLSSETTPTKREIHLLKQLPSFKWHDGLPLSYSSYFMWSSFNLAVKRPNLIHSHLSWKADKQTKPKKLPIW